MNKQILRTNISQKIASNRSLPSDRSLRSDPSLKQKRSISLKDPDIKIKQKRSISLKRSTLKKSQRLSILIIGAAGRTGYACLERFARHESKPKIHAFCKDLKSLPERGVDLCDHVVLGDATKKSDIECALRKTKANIVVVCIGNGNSTSKTDVRTESANALVNVMNKHEYKHVRALVLSRLGAGSSPKVKSGIGLGKFTSHKLKHVLNDHCGQEDAFWEIAKRVTIVRPAMLRDSKKVTGTIKELRIQDDNHRMGELSRADLASWIAEEICCGIPIGGRIANITGTSRKWWEKN